MATGYNGKTCILINSDGDAVINTDGTLTEDETIQSRVMVRLMAKRGQWYKDKNFGSNLHKRKTLSSAEANFYQDCELALKPLIDAKEIRKIEVGGIETDPGGQFRGQLFVYVSEKEVVEISGLPIGPNKRIL